MTVPATQRRAGPFTGNGVTTSFPFTFKIFDDTDVRVVVRDSVNNIESDAVLNTDYTVSANPDQESNPGGNVVFLAAPATGEAIVLLGDLDFGQPVDLPDGGAYRAQNVEDGLDRLAIQVQQLDEKVERAVQLAPTAAAASVVLPVPESLNLLGWTADGTALRNFGSTELGVEVSYAQWRTQTFNGTGGQTVFVLDFDAGSASNIDLRVNNVPQTPNVNFSYLQGTREITFLTGAPPLGSGNIVARYGQALPQGTFDLADNSVLGVKLVDGTIQTVKIGDNQITTAKIADNQVTTAKIANSQITPAKLSAGAPSWGAANEYLALPVGTTAQRPGTPTNGMIRFNGTLLRYEGYNSGAWSSIGGGATGGGTNAVFYENDQIVTSNYTIPGTKNALSAGPITIDTGITVTVSSGATWTVV